MSSWGPKTFRPPPPILTSIQNIYTVNEIKYTVQLNQYKEELAACKKELAQAKAELAQYKVSDLEFSNLLI